MKRRTRDIVVALSANALFLTIIVLLLIFTSSGCRSCKPCPEINVPKVVKVPVPVPPSLLPTPRPPSLSFAEDDTRGTLEQIAHNWNELVRAYREAVAIITENNKAVSEPPE